MVLPFRLAVDEPDLPHDQGDLLEEPAFSPRDRGGTSISRVADVWQPPGPHCPAIWNDPATPQRERKRMTRLLLTDVTVTRNAKTITCNMRWQGGQDQAPCPARK